TAYLDLGKLKKLKSSQNLIGCFCNVACSCEAVADIKQGSFQGEHRAIFFAACQQLFKIKSEVINQLLEDDPSLFASYPILLQRKKTFQNRTTCRRKSP